LDSQIDAAVNRVLERISESQLDQVREHSAEIVREHRKDMRGFERRLRNRYRVALDQLEFLLWLCVDEGGTLNQRCRPAARDTSDLVFDALTRLHARGCLVCSEVLALLRTGHPDGAMARWRSLHETAVTAMFISKHGRDTAERFLLHDRIKSYEDAKVYQEHCEKLDYEKFSDAEMENLKEQHDTLVDQFEAGYAGGNGWASHALRNATPPHKGRVNFGDLEKDVGIPHFQPYYHMASHHVHSGAKSIRFSLGVVGLTDILAAGPSNAGLADPGQNTALSLGSLTATLLSYQVSKENEIEAGFHGAAALQTIHTLVAECVTSWLVADKKLKDEDKRRVARAKSQSAKKTSPS
jgi:hypothetical protein